MPTKPLFHDNKALRLAFDNGARTAAECTRSETLAIIQEYLDSLTSAGGFSPDAWEFVLEALGENSWPALIAALEGKQRLYQHEPDRTLDSLMNGSTAKAHQSRSMLVLAYQSAAVSLVDLMFNHLEKYAARWIDEGLEHLTQVNEELA